MKGISNRNIPMINCRAKYRSTNKKLAVIT
jgi:hypothetical protein